MVEKVPISVCDQRKSPARGHEATLRFFVITRYKVSWAFLSFDC